MHICFYYISANTMYATLSRSTYYISFIQIQWYDMVRIGYVYMVCTMPFLRYTLQNFLNNLFHEDDRTNGYGSYSHPSYQNTIAYITIRVGNTDGDTNRTIPYNTIPCRWLSVPSPYYVSDACVHLCYDIKV